MKAKEHLIETKHAVLAASTQPDVHEANNTTPLKVLSATYTICKGPKLDA